MGERTMVACALVHQCRGLVEKHAIMHGGGEDGPQLGVWDDIPQPRSLTGRQLYLRELVSKAVEQARNTRAVVDRRAISRACLAQHGAGWSNLSCCLKADYERNALSESTAGAVQAREDQALSSAASEVEKAREQARRESDCGLPNQVRSVRFTALDYQRLTGSWNTIEHTELMVNEYITVALSSPAAPPRDVQLLLESSAAKFPKPTLVAPWWLKNVTTNRHVFSGLRVLCRRRQQRCFLILIWTPTATRCSVPQNLQAFLCTPSLRNIAARLCGCS